MLDYKEIIIRHYGGGMSGRALAERSEIEKALEDLK